MSILAFQLPCAGTVPLPLPVLTYPYIQAGPGRSVESTAVEVEPTGPQYYADHAATPLNTVVQQPDGIQPTRNGSGTPIPPTTPTPPPNTSTWLLTQDRAVLTEPF